MTDEPTKITVTQKQSEKITATVKANPSLVLRATENSKISASSQSAPQMILGDAPSSPTTLSTVKQGPPGPRGAGAVSILTAGENIDVYSVLVSINQLLYKADPTNINHIGKFVGVATQSVSQGTDCEFSTVGEVNGGSWTAGSIYWLGLNGGLSITPRPVGALWFQKIGIAHSADTFIVDAAQPTLIGD